VKQGVEKSKKEIIRGYNKCANVIGQIIIKI